VTVGVITPRGPRRAVLSVPADQPSKVLKALASNADEVVVDLEDSVAIDGKEAARAAVAGLGRRGAGLLAVRVNAVRSPWHAEDVAACVANDAVDTIIVPKAEAADDLRELDSRLGALESVRRRRAPVGLQALIESPAGLHRAVEIGACTDRLVALVVGYADLSAALGKHMDASWQFAQDTVLLAARLSGLAAIDGPLLSIADDDALEAAAARAEHTGFDGKWVIHPRQIDRVLGAFTPEATAVKEAREILAALAEAADAGRGACQWHGRMLDEAVAAQARRVLGRVEAP
jgi:citrate lyase subunit beta/citryl-CoA lyase